MGFVIVMIGTKKFDFTWYLVFSHFVSKFSLNTNFLIMLDKLWTAIVIYKKKYLLLKHEIN